MAPPCSGVPPSSRPRAVPADLALALLVLLLLLAGVPLSGSSGARPPSLSGLSQDHVRGAPTSAEPLSGWPVAFYVVNRSSGLGVPGASITLNRTFLGSTDGTGHLLALHPWSNGTYPLTVSATGYQVNNTTATVAGSTLVQVALTSTYQAPPPPGRLEGSYFPSTATLEIDQVQVSGSGVDPQGGIMLELNLSQGVHAWRLSDGSITAVGTFGIESGYVTWEHFSLGNGSAGSNGGSLWGVPAGGLLLDLTAGIVVGLVVATLVVVLLRRGKGRGPRAPRREGLSRSVRSGPEEGTEEDGRTRGDPASEARAGDPRP